MGEMWPGKFDNLGETCPVGSVVVSGSSNSMN